MQKLVSGRLSLVPSIDLQLKLMRESVWNIPKWGFDATKMPRVFKGLVGLLVEESRRTTLASGPCKGCFLPRSPYSRDHGHEAQL